MTRLSTLLLVLIFGFATLGQFARLDLGGGRAFYPHEALLFLFLVLHLRRPVLARLPRPAFLLFAYIFLQVCLLSFLTSLSPLIPLLYLARVTLYLLFAFTLYHAVLAKKLVSAFTFEKIWLGSLLSISILGLLQFFFLPDTRGLKYLGWDEHYFRLISTLFDPNFTGALLTLAAIRLEWLMSRQQSISLKYSLPLFTLFSFSLLLTYSRASFLAYLLGSLFIFFFTRRRSLLLIPIIFLCAIPLLPRPASEGTRLERTASIISRVKNINQTLAAPTLTNVFLGKGWYFSRPLPARLENGTLIPNRATSTDNTFVFLFSSLGVIGSALLLTLFAPFLSRLRRRPAVLVPLLALSIHALFNNTLLYPFVLLYLPALMAHTWRESL